MPTDLRLEHHLTDAVIQSALQAAFAEDMGGYGDITTLSTVPADKIITAQMTPRQDGVLAGIEIAQKAFAQIDPEVIFSPLRRDGQRIEKNQPLATIKGSAASILMAERVALNFTSHLSGIATMTDLYVRAVEGTGAKITCTRKTRPLLRAFEKYAVRAGGGFNHRFNLSDAVLIKDNHIAANGGDIKKTVLAAISQLGHMHRISVEIDRLEQIEAALAAGAQVLLLDNMPPDVLRQAVKQIDHRAVAEASGGVNLETVKAIAQSGVDYISVGRITHSAPWLDIGLDF